MRGIIDDCGEGVVVTQERALGATIWALGARCSRCEKLFLVGRYGPQEWAVVEELITLGLVNRGGTTRCPECTAAGY
jgi:hypothetical protein